MRDLMRLAVLCFGVALTSAVAADPIPMSPELKAFMMRPEQQQAVIGLMGQQWRAIVDNCPAPKLLGMNIVIAIPPNFDAGGAPLSGRWRAVGRIEGCGENHLFNVEYLFSQDGQLKRMGLLPGTTIADMLLQRDALMYASMSMVKIKPKDCKDIKYLDTRFLNFADAGPASAAGKRSWVEEWTVRACGVTGIVTMRFSPDATGTTITSSANETRQVSP